MSPPREKDTTEANEEKNQLEVGKDFEGPTGRRRCTDIFWLLLLLAHWASVTYVGFVAFGWIDNGRIGKGRPEILTNWIDHNGLVCDDDAGVHGKPYLYFPNPLGRGQLAGAGGLYYEVSAGPNEGSLASSAYGFCVEKCPDSSNDVVVDETSCEDGVCDTWDAYKSVEFVSYCVPHLKGVEVEDDAVEESNNPVFRWFQELFADVIAARVPLAITGAALPFVLGFVYMRVLRLPGALCVIVWGSILLVFAALVVVGTACYANYGELKDVDDDEVAEDNDGYERASLVCAVVFYILAAVFLCVVCCMRNAIMLAMGIVKEAGVAVADMTAIVCLPLVQAAATLAFLVVFFVYCVYVATAGEKELVETDAYGPLDMPYHTYDISNDQLYALWYLLFDAFWTLEFLAALGQLVVATAAATYYFTRDKSTIGSGVVVASARKSLFYHAGTAACGSLLIGLLRWVKAVLLYVQRKCETALARGGVAKNVARCVFCGLQCFLWCLEKCLKFLNKQAYIQTAIFGYSFCKAARKGFFLVLRNVRRVAALDAVANLIFFVTKVLVAVTCGLACFFWLGQYYREETHSILYPSLVVALVAYEVAAIFVGVVDMVADTLLVCFIADEEIYGAGSADCFATPRLRKHVAKASGKQLGTF